MTFFEASMGKIYEAIMAWGLIPYHRSIYMEINMAKGHEHLAAFKLENNTSGHDIIAATKSIYCGFVMRACLFPNTVVASFLRKDNSRRICLLLYTTVVLQVLEASAYR